MLSGSCAPKRYNGCAPFLPPPNVTIVVDAERSLSHSRVGEKKHETTLSAVLNEPINRSHHALAHIGYTAKVVFLGRIGLRAIRFNVVAESASDIVSPKAQWAII